MNSYFSVHWMFPCASLMSNWLSYFMLGPSGLPRANQNLWPVMPLRKPNTLWRQRFLEKKKKKKTNFSLFVLLSKIPYYVEGAVFLYTTCMAPAALFSPENIYILWILFVTLENNFNERREKADGLEKDPNSYSLLRKSQLWKSL